MRITELLELHGVIFAFITLLLWFAGDRHVLAGSKRCGIRDVARLNRWAGNRFLILPLIAFTSARLSVADASAGFWGVLLLYTAIFGVIIWISIGGRKF
jgi:hypothetical protein